MKMKNRTELPVQDENGYVVFYVVMILVIVTIIGISSSSTSTEELLIAGNHQGKKIAYYNSESGALGTAKIVSIAFNKSAPVLKGGGSIGIEYLGTGTPDENADTFYRQITEFDAYDDGVDIDFKQADVDAGVDAERKYERNVVGGGSEFGSGAAGIGSGYTGGAAVYFDMRSDGEGARNALSRTRSTYRKVIGMPGGL